MPSISTMVATSTRHTIHFASALQSNSDESPSPHSRPWRPNPQTGFGFQSGAVTMPDSGHLKPWWLVISALHVRITSAYSMGLTEGVVFVLAALATGAFFFTFVSPEW